MKWYLTGDTHGDFSHWNKLLYQIENPENTGIIILGDAGFNYFLNERDDVTKRKTTAFGVDIYCVRGNHEWRPEQIPGAVKKVFDDNVNGYIWQDVKFPHIKYLRDGHLYFFNDIETLVMGGAYSIDKYYRLANNAMWNPEEQLNEVEKNNCEEILRNEDVELILSHTCPYKWEPTDLFLAGLDQSQVDSSQEQWMERLAECSRWKTWCWGHFHETRFYSPLLDHPDRKRIMIHHDFIPLEEVMR